MIFNARHFFINFLHVFHIFYHRNISSVHVSSLQVFQPLIIFAFSFSLNFDPKSLILTCNCLLSQLSFQLLLQLVLFKLLFAFSGIQVCLHVLKLLLTLFHIQTVITSILVFIQLLPFFIFINQLISNIYQQVEFLYFIRQVEFLAQSYQFFLELRLNHFLV